MYRCNMNNEIKEYDGEYAFENMPESEEAMDEFIRSYAEACDLDTVEQGEVSRAQYVHFSSL